VDEGCAKGYEPIACGNEILGQLAPFLARPLETFSKNRPHWAQMVLICPYSQV
jgi:hypothetical protein